MDWFLYDRDLVIKELKSIHVEVICKQVVEKDFAKFTWYICEGVLFSKAANLHLQIL